MEFIKDLFTKIRNHTTKILCGFSLIGLGYYVYFKMYKSNKNNSNLFKSPREPVTMTPELRNDLFIMGKIRLESESSAFSPENILRIERITIKHSNLDKYTQHKLQNATKQRLLLLKELQRIDSGLLYTYSDKYRNLVKATLGKELDVQNQVA